MNIYLIERTMSVDYDEYDSVVVIANSEEEAKDVQPDHPRGHQYVWYYENEKESLKVTKIGVADCSYKSPKIILASFNAG